MNKLVISLLKMRHKGEKMNTNRALVREVHLEESPYRIWEKFSPKNRKGQKRWYFARAKDGNGYFGSQFGQLTMAQCVVIDLVPYKIISFEKWKDA